MTGIHNRIGSAQSRKCSLRTLAARFDPFLRYPLLADAVWQILPPKTIRSSTPWVYGCDGKWLGRVGVFFIHRNVTTKENLWWSFMKSESYASIAHNVSILSDQLATHGPIGAVSDWKGAIVSSVASHFGPIPHQRCLAHVQREVRRLLPRHSPFDATLALRRIATMVTLVEKPTDPQVWKTLLARWEKRHGYMLTEKTYATQAKTRSWWYTHGNLRRAWKLLTRNQDPLFVFLTNPLVPKTNNALEGVNSNLKQKLGNHRGMSKERQAAFLSWYMAFTRSKSLGDMKKLWGYWKSEFSR